MVTDGGARAPADALQPRKRKRWPSALVMDGPEIVKFTLDVVPPMIERVLEQSKWTRDDVELYLMHQATYFMLEHLRARLDLPEEKMPLALQEYGNTVSSTLPLLMHDLRAAGRLRPGTQTLLIGFGVGLSWAGCSWTETWQPRSSVAEHGGSQQHCESKRMVHGDAGSNGKPAADAAKAAEHA
jgi:3-oxoacyl-[acyl-carrier-protein] synthase-3